jgi:hypothetical protein
MPAAERRIIVYRDVADCYDRCGQESMRDRFLVLAADAALSSNQIDEAERLRSHLLQRNPHHLLKPYASFEEAMKSVDVQNYVAALRRSHPFEKAEYLLETLRPPSSRSSELPDDARILPLPEAEEHVRDQASKYRAGSGSPDPAVSCYSLQPTSPEPKPISPAFNGPSPPRSKPLTQNKRKAASTRANQGSDIYPIRPDLDPKTQWKHTDGIVLESSWSTAELVSSFLAGVVFLGGLALAVYVFVRPLLPKDWLP